MPHRVPPAGPSPHHAPEFVTLDCDVRFSGRSAAWIHLRGTFDVTRVEAFSHAIEHALAGALMVIVDLRELTAIDHSALQALLEADARAHRGGKRVVVVRGPELIERVFFLTGLSERLQVIDLGPVLVPAKPRAVLVLGSPPEPDSPHAA